MSPETLSLICEGIRCNPHIGVVDDIIRQHRRVTVSGVRLDLEGQLHLHDLPPLVYTAHVHVQNDLYQCTICEQVRQYGWTDDGVTTS